MAGYIITKRVQNLIISLKLATSYAYTLARASDKKLIKPSRKTGSKALHVTEDEEKLRAFIMN